MNDQAKIEQLERQIQQMNNRIESAFWDESCEEDIDENNRRIKNRDEMQAELNHLTGKIPRIPS